MTGRLLRRFLRSRLGLILLVAADTGLLLMLGGFALVYAGLDWGAVRSDLAYGLLVSATVLVVYLCLDFGRWWPFARQTEALLAGTAVDMAPTSLPAGATPEQAVTHALVTRLYGQATAEVERRQAAFDQHRTFMSLWVHQMKTPVSAISLIAQQVRLQGPDEVSGPMADVEEEAEKLAEGLALVLNMARLSDFSVDYRLRTVNLLDAVRSAVNGRKKQFIRLGVFPEVVAEEREWPVLTDEKWNGVVIDQILSNGLKYSAQTAAPSKRLTITLQQQADRVLLSIADQGPGIPPEDLPRVCEPFFTGANGRRFAQATGIGLYLVKQVTDRLGHRLTIASTEGAGTTVTLSYLAKL